MRLSDLRDKKVKTLDGKTLGRVHEVHCDKGSITALTYGAASFIERLTAKDEGHRILWKCVKRVEPSAIIVATDPPERKKPTGSRTPPRTRQPSGRRSKR
jgi:sporulation protein YlmC with PRC-barrel domain